MGRGRVEAGFGEEVAEEFGELLDLAEFVGHALAGLAAVVGHAEGAEPGGIGGNKVRLGAVMRRGGSGWGGRFFHTEAGGAVGLAFELGGFGGGEQVSVEKVSANERLEQGEGGGRRVVFGHIVRGVTPDKRQMRARLQRERADEEILQFSVGAAGFAERELDERALLHGGMEQSEETGTGISRHGQRSETGPR